MAKAPRKKTGKRGPSVTGPTSAKWLEVSRQFEAGCMSQQAPIVLDRGQGVMLWDVDGRAYIDWSATAIRSWSRRSSVRRPA
jgi:4-aminobutyrate aminotransferase-like enzyme